MKTALLFFILGAFASQLKAQTTLNIKDPGIDTMVYDVSHLSMPPTTPGDMDWFNHYVSDSCRYPLKAIDQGAQGRVVVSFIVEKDGNISHARILRGVTPELNDEALRLINAMPKWKPGLKAGKVVRTEMKVPITFSLQEK